MTTTIEILKAAEAGEWIEHDGKGMPVAPDTKVKVMWKSMPGQETRVATADYFLGCWDGDDIEFYRVHEPSKAISSAEEKQGAAS